MTREDLHYTEHDCNNGQIFIISPIEDCAENEGGLYCEIYENDFSGDPIDNFVIHEGADPTIVAIDYMDKYYPKVKQFDEMKVKDLEKLRREIRLGSIYYADYVNSFGFDEHDICDFFDGYIDFLQEEVDELGGELKDHDNIDTLERWYNCCEDYSWIKQTIKY